MLGLGWFEMLVIGIAALIFIGPKDLPVVMNRVGKIAGQIRRMGNDFQREINKTTGLDEVRNLRQSITAPLKKTTDEIRREFNAMTPTGVKPSGAIKPADPKAESVVEEIRAAAGMPAHADPAKLAANARAAAADPKLEAFEGRKPEVAPADAPQPAKPAAKKAPVKAKAAPTRPVITTELAPLEEKALVVSEPVLVPAVIEPASPRKRATKKPAATPMAEATVAPAPETATDLAAKPAPRKRAAKASVPTPSAGNE